MDRVDGVVQPQDCVEQRGWRRRHKRKGIWGEGIMAEREIVYVVAEGNRDFF
jgi:hypothetical protein